MSMRSGGRSVRTKGGFETVERVVEVPVYLYVDRPVETVVEVPVETVVERIVEVEVEEDVLNCRNLTTLRTSLKMTWRRLMTTWLCPSRVDFAYAGTKPDPSPQIVLHGPQFSHHYY